MRIQKSITKKLLAHSRSLHYFIHPDREFLEYLSFLYAIIDDTDLFSKVTKRDVYCIASLLNRLKSIAEQKETEILNFDHIQDDDQFVKNAVSRIVSNEEMYQIYKAIFQKREKAVNQAIIETAAGQSFDFFSDTKEQNGCCRISQSKIFAHNVTTLDKHYEQLLALWVEKAQEVYTNHEHLDLHLHIVSTIFSADDVYKQSAINYQHRDYMWIWTPGTSPAINHLTSFLNGFKGSAKVQEIHMQVQVLGENECDYSSIFKHHFIDAPAQKKIKTKKKMPVVVLSFDAGTLNSRKAEITPYLPSLVK